MKSPRRKTSILDSDRYESRPRFRRRFRRYEVRTAVASFWVLASILAGATNAGAQAEAEDPYRQTKVLDLGAQEGCGQGCGPTDTKEGGILYQGSIIELKAGSLAEIETLEAKARSAGNPYDAAFLSGMRCVILAQSGRLQELATCQQETEQMVSLLAPRPRFACANMIHSAFPCDDRFMDDRYTYLELAASAARDMSWEEGEVLMTYHNQAALAWTKNNFTTAMEHFAEFRERVGHLLDMTRTRTSSEALRSEDMNYALRNYARFMLNADWATPELCRDNVCLERSWHMTQVIKSRMFLADLRLAGQSTPNLVEMSGSLREEEVFISFLYSRKGRKPIAWKLERGKSPRYVYLPIHSEDLAAAIHAFNQDLTHSREPLRGVALVDSGGARPLDAQRRQLAEVIVRPLGLRSGQRLIISVDENFAGLPFDILPFGDGDMLDHFDISYVPSGATYFFLRHRRPRSSQTQYATQYFGAERHLFQGSGEEEGTIPDIPFVSREMLRSASVFDNSELLQNARESDLYRKRETIRSTRFIHLATHAGHENGDTTALLFHDGGDEDGKLTGPEIVAGMQNRAELVVLSACRTGSRASYHGRFDREYEGSYDLRGAGADTMHLVTSKERQAFRSGETFSSLARSFFAAGSRRLIVSQWNIPDGPLVAKLIEDVFTGLANGKTPDRALRLSKKSFRDRGVAPVHWAGFILVGD